MIFISHRGNTVGKSDRENEPDYILETLEAGYYAEVDVWNTSNGVFLGHDIPQYEVSNDFFYSDRLLCHAKNLDAMFFLIERDVHYFWHQEDDYILTSRSIFITHPRANLMPGSIAMLPELKGVWTTKEMWSAAGICSDNIARYRKVFNE